MIKIVRVAMVAVFLLSILVWGIGRYRSMNMDKIPPVIWSDSQEIHVSIHADTEELKKGLVATDNVDGDITHDIVIAYISDFLEKGVCKIKYMVFDKSNNVSYHERIVHFDDYESPTIDLTAPLMYVQNRDIILSDRIFVTDQLEGDISDKLRFSASGTTTYDIGVYELYAEARNSYGDTIKETLLLNIIPYESNRGFIGLTKYLLYVSTGDKISPEKYLDVVMDEEGDSVSHESVIITKEVDTTKPGTGQYKYEIKDKNGNVCAITFLAVIVTE